MEEIVGKKTLFKQEKDVIFIIIVKKRSIRLEIGHEFSLKITTTYNFIIFGFQGPSSVLNVTIFS